MDKAKPTKQVMPNKLSSTDRRDMLSTIYKRTQCAAKTPIPRSISKNDNASSSIGQKTRQSSPSESGRRDVIPSIYKRTQPVAITPIPGSLSKNKNGSGGFNDSGSCSSLKSREQNNLVVGADSSPCQGSTKHNNRKRKSPYIFSGPLGYPQNGPTSDIIWKGTFEVLNLSHEMGLCEGFVARPSAKLSEKAYKFTKQIAGALKFKLEPRTKRWPKIFQIRSPDRDDVALYFYPGKSERSIKKYSDLLKYMDKNDLVLRVLMGLGHVELLVFASKTLALDCRLLNHNYFMWGVFRALKGEARTRNILTKYT